MAAASTPIAFPPMSTKPMVKALMKAEFSAGEKKCSFVLRMGPIRAAIQSRRRSGSVKSIRSALKRSLSAGSPGAIRAATGRAW
jgi:hypothetical protein